MSKKRKKPVPTNQPKQEKKMVIDMNRVNLAKARTEVSFRTGEHKITRPRKKNWRKEIEVDD